MYANSVKKYSEEKHISKIKHGKKSTRSVAVNVLVMLAIEACMNTAVSIGLSAVSVTFTY